MGGACADLFLLAIALAYGEDALVKTLRQPGPSREPLDLLSNAAPADTLTLASPTVWSWGVKYR